MKISVFGSGYVGLVQATVLAEVGHDVICMDVDKNKVESLQKGHVTIFEPGLAAMVKENLESGRLHFTHDEKLAVEHGDTAWNDFAGLGYVGFQSVEIFVIDLFDVFSGEAAKFTTTEETCHLIGSLKGPWITRQRYRCCRCHR